MTSSTALAIVPIARRTTAWVAPRLCREHCGLVITEHGCATSDANWLIYPRPRTATTRMHGLRFRRICAMASVSIRSTLLLSAPTSAPRFIDSRTFEISTPNLSPARAQTLSFESVRFSAVCTAVPTSAFGRFEPMTARSTPPWCEATRLAHFRILAAVGNSPDSVTKITVSSTAVT